MMLWQWRFKPCDGPSCPKRSMLIRFGTNRALTFRKKRYCSAECFQEAAAEVFAVLLLSQPPRLPKLHRLPLGLLMLSEGWISEQDLKAALQAQRTAQSGRIGEWFCRLGAASEERVTAAVGKQWAKPVLALDASVGLLPCAEWIPAVMLEHSVMVPAHFAEDSRTLYVAFANQIDYSVLDGIERMLHCRTEPCLARQSSIEGILEIIRQQERPTEIRFDGMRDPHEMARVAASYVAKIGAEEIQIEKCGPHIWLQLRSGQALTNLVFGLRADQDETVSVLPEAGVQRHARADGD